MSKSLYKQSIKANGVMWLVITFAVCFMLSCVMLIAGNGNIGQSKTAIKDTIIQGELTSQIQSRALNYYETSNEALLYFDECFKTDFITFYTNALMSGMNEDQAEQLATMSAYKSASEALQEYYLDLINSLGYQEGSVEALEIQGLIFYIFNPLQLDESHMFDDFYTIHGEAAPRYELLFANIINGDNTKEREKYAMTNSIIFLAGNMVKEENINSILNELVEYGVTTEQYSEFGFDKYSKIKDIAISTLVDYRANLEYRLDNMNENETIEQIKTELTKDSSRSMLASLPTEVSDALQEIGKADLYGTLVGSVFFKMSGLLLPIIYMIMVANALIAGQVDSGSMAYILSTSTKRKEVTFTQALFLITSLLAMFVLTTITSVICFSLVDVNTSLTYGKLLLINLGAFIVMFAMSGISFLASCWFNRSKHSMALGGGLNMFFLVATMLGLFGSPVLPSIIRMDSLNYFNYLSIISLFDVLSILEGTFVFWWKLIILVAIGVVCYIIGSIKFTKKDLPL